MGFVVVRPREEGLLLDHLYVTPAAQGLGVGAAVLGRICAEADSAGQSLRVGALLVEVGEWDNYYIRRARSAAARQKR